MKYPAIGASSSYRFSIPKLNGGVNAHDAVSQIEDNQLSDCKNMWFHDGVLQTRPGLHFLEETMEQKTGYLPTLYGGTYDVTDGRLGSCRRFLEATTEQIVGTEMKISYTLHTVGYTGEQSFGRPVTYDPLEKSLAFFVESGAGNWEGVKRGGAMLFLRQSPISNRGNSIFAQSESGGWVSVSQEVYVPHVLINGYPTKSGDNMVSTTGYSGEGFNLLTPKFRCTYTTDGKGDTFNLPLTDIDDSEVTITYITRGQTLEYTIPAGATESNEAGGYYFRLSRAAGSLYAAKTDNKPYSVALPDEGIKENIIITAAKTTPGSEKIIFGMQFCTWYGGGGGLYAGTRLFVSGNDEEPGLVHWSDVNNPLYFPENNYAYIGNAGQSVTAFGKQGEKLIIFKEHEIYFTTYNAGSISTEAVMNSEIIDITANTAQFPIVQLHPSIGCDCPKTIQLCDNRLIWATSTGDVYCLSTTNALSETTVHLLSRNVEKWLSTVDAVNFRSLAFAYDYAGYYVLMFREKAFALNYADSQFLYQVAYSGGKKDGDKLKWFVWEYTLFATPEIPEAGIQREITKTILSVISNGKDAIALCWDVDSVVPGYRYLADFSGVVDDYVYEGQRIYQIGRMEIPCLFQTKMFDMGYPEQEKIVQQVYITASNRSERTATVSYLSTRGITADTYQLEQRETVGTDSPQYMSINRLTPNLSRIHHFGLRLESAGGISVGDIAVKYKRMGRSGR